MLPVSKTSHVQNKIVDKNPRYFILLVEGREILAQWATIMNIKEWSLFNTYLPKTKYIINKAYEPLRKLTAYE